MGRPPKAPHRISLGLQLGFCAIPLKGGSETRAEPAVEPKGDQRGAPRVNINEQGRDALAASAFGERPGMLGVCS